MFESEAANVIYTIENTLSNYQIAWDLLNERFDINRIIMQRHVKNLFDLPVIIRESSGAIRSIPDSVQTKRRSLKNLIEGVDH